MMALNDQPFKHRGRYLTFEAKRCDFVGGVSFTIEHLPQDCRPEDVALFFMEDVAGMIGYHATVIHPYLNGFAGYDAISLGYDDGSGKVSGMPSFDEWLTER